MKDTPILMNGPMVRATLDRIKTMTRRVITPQPTHFNYYKTPPNGGELTRWPIAKDGTQLKSPYGKPGDRLWVRETFWCDNDTDNPEYSAMVDCGSMLSLGEDFATIQYCASPEYLDLPEPKHSQIIQKYKGKPCHGHWWLAPPISWDGTEKHREENGIWMFQPTEFYTKHPSIHMPRWASRISLEITDIRVERVQEISEADAKAEGIESEHAYDGKPGFGYDMGLWYKDYSSNAASAKISCPKTSFQTLWDSINAKRGYSWDVNPWVWVIIFKLLEVRGG